MIFLDERNIKQIGICWETTINTIEAAVRCLAEKDFAQPIKPYLRYKDLANRIIAMPAFLGGAFNIAGIKWIASFPQNITKNIPRAHSVVILNNADTGVPEAIINTPLLSIIRTASVSGLMIRYFQRVRKLDKFNLGIIGWGPIGQYHFKMCTELYGDQISKIYLYDLRDIDISKIDYQDRNKIIVTKNWMDAYRDSDVFITCTVSKAPYINKAPKLGSLQLNVSLRDYMTDVFEYVKNSIIVDDWDEVCRENTDIEKMNQEKGLIKEQTKSIVDVVVNNCLENYPVENPIFFSPMGMSVFDIATATHYVGEAKKNNIGTRL